MLPPAPRFARYGFSVMELLLVVLVAAVLLALVMPVVSSARARVVSTRCIHNLQQVGAALLAYSVDHRSLIPPRIEEDPENPGQNLSGTYWHQVLRAKGYLPRYGEEESNAARARAQRQGAHFCPSLPSKGGSEEAYGMRRWRTPGGAMDTTQNLSVLENRADFFLLADSYKPATETQGYSLGGGSTAYRIHLVHGGRANALFADGHVEAKGRDYFVTLPVRQKAYQNALPFAFWPETP